MSDTFFEQNRATIKSGLDPIEQIGDIEMMYSIIVQARREQRSTRNEDKRISLWSLCFLGVPIKAPRYVSEIRQFRKGFIGITFEVSQQQSFRKSLKPALLEAESIKDLKAEKLSDLFDAPSGYNEPHNPTGGTTGTHGGSFEDEPVLMETQAEENALRASRPLPATLLMR